jgi:alkylation response protein AidB-like acyl-CoA dehydrogenase
MSPISGPGPTEPMSTNGPEPPSYTRDDLLTAARKLAPGIRAASDEIERGRTLTEPIVQALADAGLYRMFLPRSLGGESTRSVLRCGRG